MTFQPDCICQRRPRFSVKCDVTLKSSLAKTAEVQARALVGLAS